jgi:hypothetical protein
MDSYKDLLPFYDFIFSLSSMNYNSILKVKIMRNKKVPIKSIRSESTELVSLDKEYTLGSTIGINLNSNIRKITYLPKNIRSQIIGHLLGDGSLLKT